MSLFDFFRNSTASHDSHPVSEGPETPWQDSSQPDVFFPGYQRELEGKLAQGLDAEVETLRAQKEDLQNTFIANFQKRLDADLARIKDPGDKEKLIIDATQAVRHYNQDMSVDIRTKLAKLKHDQIALLNNEHDRKL